jgi:serine/threonine protein phosphatase PrpC
MRATGESAGWRITVASVIGPGHERAGLPNQDRWLVHPVGTRACLYAVADGAGSRDRSDEGAQFAVLAAAEAAESVFGAAGFPAGIAGWRTAMRTFRRSCLQGFDRSVKEAALKSRAADPAGAPPVEQLRREFATTLLAVVAAPPYFGYLSVGDCFLVVDRRPGEPALVVSAPEREHAGVTTFLTSGNRDEHVHTGVLLDDRISALALCSDGVAEGLLSARQDGDGVLRYLAPPEFRAYFDLFGDQRVDGSELGAKLASPEFAVTSSDDKTIVMAVRRP